MGPIASVSIGVSNLKWATKIRLSVGMAVDHKVTWTSHVLNISKSFESKLDLLKRSPFLYQQRFCETSTYSKLALCNVQLTGA